MSYPEGRHHLDLALKYIIWYSVKKNIRLSPDPQINSPSLPEEFLKLRSAAFSDREALSQYIKTNPDNLDEVDLAISTSFIHTIQGRFIITSVLKDSMLFLYTDPDNTNYLIKVFPLSEDVLVNLKMIGLPRLAETILFPYKDRITYDSLSMLSITFGSGYKQSITSDAKKAKAKFGLITTLPIQKSYEDLDLINLRGYITSKQSINDYWDDIWYIVNRKPEYQPIFYQRLGEIYSRERKKELKNEGIESGWFAMLGYKVVSGGKSRKIAEEAALGIIPDDKRGCLYYFQINEKKKKR